MARTYNTRPHWVRAQDRPEFVEPVHDHRLGPCDLPEERVIVDDSDTRCRWVFSEKFWASPVARACCTMCSAQPERRQDRRRERAMGRRYVRGWWREDW